MKPGKDFSKWYASYEMNKKPTIAIFATLPFATQIGIFLQYFYDRGYIILVSNHGYKVFKARVINEDRDKPIFEYMDTFGIDDPIMTFYKDAFDKCFQLINNIF